MSWVYVQCDVISLRWMTEQAKHRESENTNADSNIA